MEQPTSPTLPRSHRSARALGAFGVSALLLTAACGAEEPVVEAEREVTPAVEDPVDAEGANGAADEAPRDVADDDLADETVAVFEDPDAFLGQDVTLSGEIVEMVTPLSYRISPVAGAGTVETDGTLLVVAAQEPPVAAGEVIRVDGTLMEFDLATFEEDLGVDLDDAALSSLAGEKAIAAHTVSEGRQ